MTVATTLPALCRGASPEDARVRAAVDAHYVGLWRFLRRMGVDESQVEDALQQVLLVFARRAAELAPEAERSFLFGTALRVASDFRRRDHRVSEFADSEALVRQRHPAPDAQRQLEEQELRRCLDDLLDALAPEHRAVFVLAEIEELTMADIARLLSIPPGTVASRLRRARELFEAGALALKARLDAETPS